MKTLDRGLRGQSLAARLSCVVLIVVAAVGVSGPAWASGVVNHQEIVERAIRQIEASPNPPAYLAVLKNNRKGHVYYGSMFPDWGSAKYWVSAGNPEPPGDYIAMTEIAHDTSHYQNPDWRTLARDEARQLPIFLQTLLAHAAPRAKSGDDAALAFLFGVASHQVSDAAFHFDQNGMWGKLAFQREAEKWHMPETDKWFFPDPPILHVFLELALDAYYYDHGYIKQWADREESKCTGLPVLCVRFDFPTATLEAIGEAYGVATYTGSDGIPRLHPPTVAALQSGLECQSRMYIAASTSPTTPSAWATWYRDTWPAGGMTDMVGLTIDAWDDTWTLLGKYHPLTTVATQPREPDGNNGWYREPVILTLTGEDSYLGVKDYGGPFRTYYQFDASPREEYGAPLVVSTEGQTTISLSSVDAFGNAEMPKPDAEPPEQANPFVLKIDLTPPVVTVTPSSTLTRIQLIHFSGHDPQPGSGLLSLAATLNQQPLTGEVIDPFWWGPGVYTLELTGEDLAGWVTSETHHLELQTTLESLQPTVARLCQDAHITQAGICNALSAKLNAAVAARDHGNPNAMAGALNAFQNAVNAQAGKAISSEAAALLLADSGYVLTH